jgi:uncharacterized protein YndB with AHSA1/START domain
VWDAFTNPALIKQYMVGTDVTSSWKVALRSSGTANIRARKYEDKGVILRLEPLRVLEYSRFSPLAGKPDVPENYHTVTIELSSRGDGTEATLSQDNNPTEESIAHTAKFWQAKP